MDAVGIIPARYESTRLPRKLLLPLLGKPLIQWTWEAAKKASFLDDIIIACDHPEIEKTAKAFGAKVVLTPSTYISGTERICGMLSDIKTDIVVNIQADEPLIHHLVINSLVDQLRKNNELQVATARRRMNKDEDAGNPNTVKVVVDKNDFALYFSRAKIPFDRDGARNPVYYKHIGIYAYSKEFLYVFKRLPVSMLEDAERLEQLRVLEAGYKIKVIETEWNCVGVDTEEDLKEAEKMLRGRFK